MTKAVAAASIDVTANITKLQKQLDRAESRIKRMEGKARQSSRGISRSFSSVASSARTMALGIGAAAAAIGFAAKQIGDAGIKMQGLDRAFRAATGSAEAGAREFSYIRSEAERLGLDLEESAKAYAKLAAAAKGTTLEGKDARDIFSAVAEASRVMSLSTEQTQGALTALEQIISKGKVSAEELRGQLGERLPGAFQIAARSIGVTTAELDDLLKQGKLTAEQLLPALATELRKTFGPEVESAANDAQAAYNRFGNALFDLQATIASSGVLDALTVLAKAATKATLKLGDFLRQIGLVKDTEASFNAAAVEYWRDRLSDANEKLKELRQEAASGPSLFDSVFGGDRDIDGEIRAQLDAISAAEEALKRLSKKTKPKGLASEDEEEVDPTISARAGIQRAAQIRLEALRRSREAEAALDDEFLRREVESRQFTDSELLRLAEQSATAKVIAAFNAEQAAKGETGQALNPEQELELLRKYNDEKLAEYERFVNERARISAKQAQADQAATRAQIQSDSIAKQSKERLVSTLTGLLGVLGGKSKAAAIALIALEKAKALADNKMYTIVAMQKARALLGPGLGDAEAARIAKIGAVNAGLIAATGLGQAIGALTGGGGAAIGSYSSGETLGGTDGEADGAESRSTVQIIFNGDVNGLDSYVEEKLVPAIRDATKDRDLVLIDPNSRNAADIRGIE